MLDLVHSSKTKTNGTPTTEQILQVQLQRQAQQLSQLAGIVCALLKEKHQGCAFVEMKSLGELANWKVQFQAIPEVGSMRLQLQTPNGQPFVPADLAPATAPVPAAASPEIEAAPAEQAPSAPCASQWHKDGVGLRCPDCGSIERVKE